MKYDREKLYQEVWAEPTSTVAIRYGVSDVALAKACRAMAVPTPPRGYWAKVKAGKAAIEKPALPPAPQPKVKEPAKKPTVAAPAHKENSPIPSRRRKALIKTTVSERADCEAFYHCYMICSEDLIYHFNFLIDNTVDDYPEHSNTFQQRRTLFLERCKTAISTMHLPLLTSPWMYYDCIESYNGFEIVLAKLTAMDYEGLDVTATEEETIGVIATFDYEMISSHEFAIIHNVSDDIVMQWLLSGNIPGATYENGEWSIPELHQRPNLEEHYVHLFFCDEDNREVQGFPLLALCSEMSLDKINTTTYKLQYINTTDTPWSASVIISVTERDRILNQLQMNGVPLNDDGRYRIACFERPAGFMMEHCSTWNSLISFSRKVNRFSC